MRRILLLVVLAVPSSTRLEAQRPIPPGTELDDYVRLLEITGRLTGAALVFRPLAARHVGSTLRADSAHPWDRRASLRPNAAPDPGLHLTLLDPSLHAVVQSAYPRGVNDGALWAGKGLSAEISGGAMAALGPLTATFLPTVYAAANTYFATAPVSQADRSSFSYPWQSGIDWPQRLGSEVLTEFDWGQSGIRLDLAGFTAGLTTENLWWGPAQRHPILMSNTAPGFPHAELGTGRPVRTAIGKVETRLVWGSLSESGYFDTASTNDRRFFAGLTAAIEPRWVPGLTLGLGRVFYLPWDSVDAGDVLLGLQTVFKEDLADSLNPGGDDDRDQMLSFYARWVLPESGFEAYVEWSRNDHNWDLRDFILEPDHSQAFVVGWTKAIASGPNLWRLRGEMTHLERSRTFQVRASPVYYTHHVVQQGYTHKGQLIGAGIGPGGSAQFFSVDRYSPEGRMGLYAERVRYDNDAYYELFGPTDSYLGHDVELTLGLSALRFVGDFDLRGVLAISRELNRYFRVSNDVTNLRAEATVTWRVR